MITCILLAAGLNRRFGSPKALARLGGCSVIQHLQDTLIKSFCDEIIVVLGAHANEIEPSIFIHSRIRVVHNKHYNFGQTSSVQAGCREAAPSTQGVMFIPVDCPLVLTSTVNTLIDRFRKDRPEILVPTYRDKKGHPPVFSRQMVQKVLDLPSDKGLNSLFVRHPPSTLEIDDAGIIKSFNTPEEFEKMKVTSKR